VYIKAAYLAEVSQLICKLIMLLL